MGQWPWEDRARFIDMLLDEEKSKPSINDIRSYIMGLSLEERQSLVAL
jgi:hypothetical protein